MNRPFKLNVYRLRKDQTEGETDYRLEEFRGLDILYYIETRDVWKVRFKPGNIFGVQFIPGHRIKQNKPIVFEHLETRFKLLFCDPEEVSEMERFYLLLSAKERRYIDRRRKGL